MPTQVFKFPLSATGQPLNPIYDWKATGKDGYSWWIFKRLRESFPRFYDVVRNDYFVDLNFTGKIPASSDKVAPVNGLWTDYALFKAVKEY